MRRRNEHIAGAAAAHHFDDVAPVPFLCECSDGDCTEVIRLPLSVYRVDRRAGDYLAVPGHEVDGATLSRVTEHCWVHRSTEQPAA